LDNLIDEPSDSEDDDPDTPGFAIDPDDGDPQVSIDWDSSGPVFIELAFSSHSFDDCTPEPQRSLYLTLCRLQF
jgi:hypothetical protein